LLVAVDTAETKLRYSYWLKVYCGARDSWRSAFVVWPAKSKTWY